MYDVHREETFEFPITDENDTACSAIFYMDEEGSQKQIGDEQTYILNLLKKGKPIFKGTRVYTDGRTESARMTPRTTQISIANVCTYSLTLFACVRACVRVCVCVCVCVCVWCRPDCARRQGGHALHGIRLRQGGCRGR